MVNFSDVNVHSWSFDRDSRVKVQGLRSTSRVVKHIISIITAKNSFHLVKAIVLKLWKSGGDILDAYSMINVTKKNTMRDLLENKDKAGSQLLTAECIGANMEMPTFVAESLSLECKGCGHIKLL